MNRLNFSGYAMVSALLVGVIVGGYCVRVAFI